MRLKVISARSWRIVSPLEDGEQNSQIEREIMEYIADPRTRAAAQGFIALWERIPKEGPRALGTDLYHCVDEKQEIYEFIKGPLRLLCFEADGAIVVCSNIFRKTSKKTKSKNKRPAIELKRKYLDALSRNRVKFVEE